MKLTINSTGQVITAENGRDAVKQLCELGLLTWPGEKFNPSMILAGPIRRGEITLMSDEGGQLPFNTGASYPEAARPEPRPASHQNHSTDSEPEQAAAMIAEALRLIRHPQNNTLDVDRVRELILEETQKISEKIQSLIQPQYKGIEVRLPSGDRKKIDGYVHPSFNNLLAFITSGCNVWLTGPAGSGKTTAAMQAAEALGLSFYSTSVCAHSNKIDLAGYMGATGAYVETDFFRAYTKGGVFLLDEADAGSPSVMNWLNQALSNGHCSFPGGIQKKHDDFYCIAAANTLGNGSDLQYVGRQVQEATLLDRFIFLYWGYDEAGEANLCGFADIAKNVQALRKKALDAKMRVIISPRASISIARLMAMGVNESSAFEAAIFAKLSQNDRKTLTV